MRVNVREYIYYARKSPRQDDGQARNRQQPGGHTGQEHSGVTGQSAGQQGHGAEVRTDGPGDQPVGDQWQGASTHNKYEVLAR